MNANTGDFAVHYQLLNPSQRRAVDHQDGPLLVVAGAGTGKTQIIALRIAKLLQDTDIAPNNILCLTFTESGVIAMRQRLLHSIGQAAYNVRIHTFHSFCNEVIQDHPEQFLFTYDLAPLSDVERVRLFMEVIDQLPPDSPLKPFAAPYYYITDLSQAIQSLKRENVTKEKYLELLKTHETELAAVNVEDLDRTAKQQHQSWLKQLPKQTALAEVYELYQTTLRQHGRYDYEDMLLFVVDAFSNNKELLADYQEQYQYILVDEYQDTNNAQNEIIRLLGSYFENPNICVVGDDRQSIYRFQGASLENILFFNTLYKDNTTIISLQDNYRSQQTILDAAESLIFKNQYSLQQVLPQIPQHLVAARDLEAKPIQLAEFSQGEVEYYWVAQRIKELLDSGVPGNEIAVLYRNHRDGVGMVELCERLQIPFQLLAGVNVVTDSEVQKLVKLLRWLGHSDNDELLFQIMQWPIWELPPVDLMKLSHFAYRSHRPMLSIITSPAVLTESGVDHPEQFTKLAERLAAWKQVSANKALVDFVSDILSESGLLQHWMAQDNRLQHLNRVNSLVAELKSLNRAEPDLTAQQFVEYLDLLEEHAITIPEHELHTQREAVQLLTAHRAKGLEFAHVFMIKCVDRHWGHQIDRAKIKLPPGIVQFDATEEKDKRLEDDRRLFYVALTRAKTNLTITYAQHYGGVRTTLPSSFISDIAEQYIERLDVTAAETQTEERLQLTLKPAPVTEFGVTERAYITQLVEHYALSATHLNSYLQCPRQFYFEHILHVPRSNTRSFAFGTAVHDALRDLALHFDTEKKLGTSKFLVERFEHHLTRQLLNRKQYRDSLAFGKVTLAAYYKEYKTDFARTILAEKDFTPYQVHIEGVPIVGKIDRLDIISEADHTVHVIDYKTGNPDNKGGQLGPNGDYHRQVVFYKLLCDGAKEFGYTAVSGEIQFVQPSKTKHDFTRRVYEFTEDEVEQTRSEVVRVFTAIKNLEFLNPPEEALCGECAYCLI